MFIGWWKLPQWVKNRQALALGDPNDPARVALGGAITEDVMPKFVAEFEKLVEPLKRKLSDLDDQRVRVEAQLAEMVLTVKGLKIPEMPKEIQIDTAAFRPMIAEEIQSAMKSAWGKRLTAGAAEDAGGALEDAAEAVALAQKDPGNAERLVGFIKAVETSENLGLLKPAQAKKAIEQARQLWRTGQDLLPLAQRFGISVEGGGIASTGSKGGPI